MTDLERIQKEMKELLWQNLSLAQLNRDLARDVAARDKTIHELRLEAQKQGAGRRDRT